MEGPREEDERLREEQRAGSMSATLQPTPWILQPEKSPRAFEVIKGEKGGT